MSDPDLIDDLDLVDAQPIAHDDAGLRLPGKSPIDDIPVKVSVVLGRKKIDIASLRALGEGSVIELDRRVGEPVDIYVNEQLIARGELVRVDDGIGVSLTELTQKHQDAEI